MATHWPFAAVILGYERWWLMLKDRPSAKSSFAALSPGPSSSSSLLRRPACGKFPPDLVSAGERAPWLAQQTRAAYSTVVPASTVASETIEALEVLAGNLTSQPETIEMLLERERARRPAATSWPRLASCDREVTITAMDAEGGALRLRLRVKLSYLPARVFPQLHGHGPR